MIAGPYWRVGLRRKNGIKKQASHFDQYESSVTEWQDDGAPERRRQGRVAAGAHATTTKWSPQNESRLPALGTRAGGFGKSCGSAQKSMPPMPPPGGIAGGVFGSGFSATIASVVIKRPATDAASCRACRTTLVGSMMPARIMSVNSPFCASYP